MTISNLPVELIEEMRECVASGSIGASTARGMGQGTVKAARDFLKSFKLDQFTRKCKSADTFATCLEVSTRKLRKKLPSRSWGAARKFLNIFLRGVSYNRYLNERYGLARLEPYLEVPLDKSVAMGLRKEEGGSALPRWRTIIRLKQDDSKKYQEFAKKVAENNGHVRVHLDVRYWRKGAP